MTVKSLWFMASLMAVASAEARRGVGSSGGGYAVVCRGLDRAILSAETLDLFEARTLHGLRLIEGSGDVYRDFARVVQTYRRMGGDSRPLGSEVEDHFQQILQAIHFVPESKMLEPADDLGEVVAPPAGCAIEQLAIFKDDSNQLFVARDIWSRLDSLSQAALLQHEVAYLMFRKVGESTSRNARRLIGQLFSTSPGSTLPELVGSDALLCTGGSEIVARGDGWISRGSTGPRAFFFYVSAERDRAVVHFMRILGRDTLVPITVPLDTHFDGSQLRTVYDPSGSLEIPSKVVVSDPSAQSDRIHIVPHGIFEGYGFQVTYVFNEPISVTIFNPSGRIIDHMDVESCSRTSL